MSDDDVSPGEALFALANLYRQLDNAHKEIARLQELVRAKQATEFARVVFGFDPKTEPCAMTWEPEGRLLAVPCLDRFRKVNTDVMTASAYVTRDVIKDPAWGEALEREVMKNALGVLFCDMQRRGLFQHTKKRGEFEDVYTVGIEVAAR